MTGNTERWSCGSHRPGSENKADRFRSGLARNAPFVADICENRGSPPEMSNDGQEIATHSTFTR